MDFNYEIAEDQNIEKGDYVLYTNPHPQSRLKNKLMKVAFLHKDSQGNRCFQEVTKYLSLNYRRLDHATKVVNLDEKNNEKN